MRRRDFMGMLGGAAAWPIAGAAQTPGRVYRFGIFTPSSKSAGVREPGQLVILEEMRLAGFIEGQNLQVLDEGFGVPESELAAGAAALVKAAPDAIQAGHPKYAKAARAATQTIPIVTTTEDMVADGFSTSVAHPDGNVTGISLLSLKLDGKRGDLLAEAVPGLRQMAVLADPGTHKPEHIRDLTELAKARGLELSAFFAKTRDEIVPALDAAKAAGAGAINVLAGQLFYFNHELVIERVQELRLPAIYQWPEWAKRGPHRLRIALRRSVPHHGSPTRRELARNGARGHSDRTANEVRIGDQSEDRQGARRRDTTDVTRERGPNSRMRRRPIAHHL